MGLWAWCTVLCIFFSIDLVVESSVHFLFTDTGLTVVCSMRLKNLGYAGKENLFVFHIESRRGGVEM